MTARDEVVELVKGLSPTASLDEISEEVQILAALRRSEASVAAGRVKTHEEVKAWFTEYSKKWNAK